MTDERWRELEERYCRLMDEDMGYSADPHDQWEIVEKVLRPGIELLEKRQGRQKDRRTNEIALLTPQQILDGAGVRRREDMERTIKSQEETIEWLREHIQFLRSQILDFGDPLAVVKGTAEAITHRGLWYFNGPELGDDEPDCDYEAVLLLISEKTR